MFTRENNHAARRDGQFEVASTAGEVVHAFIPTPLPPVPPLDLTGQRQKRLEASLLACGRLTASRDVA